MFLTPTANYGIYIPQMADEGYIGEGAKDTFSKIKNQLTEFEKDKIKFLWKHFQEAKAVSNLIETDAKKVF